MGGSCCSNRAPLNLDVKDPVDEVDPKDPTGLTRKKIFLNAHKTGQSTRISSSHLTHYLFLNQISIRHQLFQY